jgi:hypothetical protein
MFSGWDLTAETAYGSVDIASNCSTVIFQNIQQLTWPSVGGTGLPVRCPSSSLTWSCDQTYFGNTIPVPEQAVITGPGLPGNGNSLVSPQAIIGIGPSEQRVEIEEVSRSVKLRRVTLLIRRA